VGGEFKDNSSTTVWLGAIFAAYKNSKQVKKTGAAIGLEWLLDVIPKALEFFR